MFRSTRVYHSAAIAICCAILCTFLGFQAHAGIILFEETWNAYGNNENNPFLADPDTADETWFGGRFEAFDNNPLSNDLNVRYVSGTNINGNYFRMEDDGGILFNVSTAGYTNVTLSYNWRTHLAEGTDKLKVGYTANNGDGVLDYFDLSGAGDRARDFVNEDFGGVHQDAVDWWDDNFTTLLFAKHEGSWLSETHTLPANTASVWVAFFMDDGMDDNAKIDNIVVMGDPIPEPASLVLLLTAGCLLPRKRRFAQRKA